MFYNIFVWLTYLTTFKCFSRCHKSIKIARSSLDTNGLILQSPVPSLTLLTSMFCYLCSQFCLVMIIIIISSSRPLSIGSFKPLNSEIPIILGCHAYLKLSVRSLLFLEHVKTRLISSLARSLLTMIIRGSCMTLYFFQKKIINLVRGLVQSIRK